MVGVWLPVSINWNWPWLPSKDNRRFKPGELANADGTGYGTDAQQSDEHASHKGLCFDKRQSIFPCYGQSKKCS